MAGIVFKERIYKIWKQFTTPCRAFSTCRWLCSKNEYTKSESNSQPRTRWVFWLRIVFKERIYKIWKQFTTALMMSTQNISLCSKNEYTKSESNSQPFAIRFGILFIVFKERIYKIWKQFTTPFARELIYCELCSKNEYTKSESNSQRLTICFIRLSNCVQRTNIQNLKAIHNNPALMYGRGVIVFKERIYKIWKQFTTLCKITP